MRKHFILILSIVTTFFTKVAAQDKLPDFGKIDIADLQLKECPFDKSADAMSLIKTRNVTFSIDSYTGIPRTNTEYRVRIKIFKETGFEHASIVIPYTGNNQSTKITDVEGYIYNLDSVGNVVTVKLEKGQVFKERSRAKRSHNEVRFTFPGLKAGSVVEYRYTRIDKDGVYMPPWLFQEELPARYTLCTVTIPSYMRIEYHFVASLPIEKDSLTKKYGNSFYNEDIRSFAMRNVPAFKMEPYMSSFKDNVQRVEFSVRQKSTLYSGSLNTRWAVYGTMLLFSPYFGVQFNEDIAGTSGFVASVKTLQQRDDKINALYGYVKKNINWNGEHSIYSDGLNECWKEGSGNSAEMNIMLINLLKKAGINCYPILVSTRDNGKLDQTFPSLSQFNSVDVLVVEDSTVYVIDCTQKNLSIKTTPFDVLNTDAFLVDEQGGRWVNVADSRPLMHTELYINAKMDSLGLLSGNGQVVYTGIAKAEAIAEEEKEKKDRQNSKGLVDNDAPDLKIDSSSTVHGDDDNDTLIQNIFFHSNVSNTGDIYFLNPFLFSMFKKNPFKDSVRLSDIDFGSNQVYSTRMLVIVPDNFSVEELPRSVFIRTADSSLMFKREIISAGSQVLIRNSFNINREVFDKEEYTGIRSFFDKVYGLINEQVVLKKKE